MLSNQHLSIHAAVAGAMHASAIHARAATTHINSVCSGVVREFLVHENTALAAAVATGRCTRKVFSFFFHMNVAGTVHINSV